MNLKVTLHCSFRLLHPVTFNRTGSSKATTWFENDIQSEGMPCYSRLNLRASCLPHLRIRKQFKPPLGLQFLIS